MLVNGRGRGGLDKIGALIIGFVNVLGRGRWTTDGRGYKSSTGAGVRGVSAAKKLQIKA